MKTYLDKYEIKLNSTFLIPHDSKVRIEETDLPFKVSLESSPEQRAFKGTRWKMEGAELKIQIIYSESTSRGNWNWNAFNFNDKSWHLGIEAALVSANLLRVTLQILQPSE